MTKETKRGALFFLYIGQLIELGLIESLGDASFQLTTKGFDEAIDLYNGGYRLSEWDIITLILATPGMEDEEFQEALRELIMHLQDIGYDKMKENVQAVNNK